MGLVNAGVVNVRGAQTGTTSPISKKGFGYVYSIILDETHPRIKEKVGNTISEPNMSLIGCIEFRFSSDNVSDEENLPLAYPFDKNFVNLPVRNETVEIWQGEGGQNFYRRIGDDITPNINADEKAISKTFAPKSTKDNLITNDITPSKQELTRRMGDGILTYTRTEDGRFIPIWSESI